MTSHIVELAADQIIAIQNLDAGEICLNLIIQENKDIHENLLTLELHCLVIQDLSPSSTSCTWQITAAGHQRLRNLPTVEAARLRLFQLNAIPEQQRSENEDQYAKMLARMFAFRDGEEHLPDGLPYSRDHIDGALAGILSAEQLQFRLSNPRDR
jgi:hypothetical protein